MLRTHFILLGIAVCGLLGCVGDSTDDDAASNETATDDSPGDGDGDAGMCVATGDACPNYATMGEDVTCDLDNTTAIDLVQDARLEFGEGPDDAVRFTAPTAGDYAIWMENDPSTNEGCGVSAYNADQELHTAALCPAVGATVDLDGYFSSMDNPVSLTAGQEIVLFVGCSYWADAQSGPYQLRIQKI